MKPVEPHRPGTNPALLGTEHRRPPSPENEHSSHHLPHPMLPNSCTLQEHIWDDSCTSCRRTRRRRRSRRQRHGGREPAQNPLLLAPPPPRRQQPGNPSLPSRTPADGDGDDEAHAATTAKLDKDVIVNIGGHERVIWMHFLFHVKRLVRK